MRPEKAECVRSHGAPADLSERGHPERSGRNIGLTEAGERVYKWANDVVMRTREMERELSGLEDGVAGSAVLASSNLVWRELVEAQLSSYGVETPNVILEFGHAEAQKHAVRSDLGLCFFLETSIRADVARGELRVVDTPGMRMAVPLYLAYRREKEFSPFQTSLIGHIRTSAPFA